MTSLHVERDKLPVPTKIWLPEKKPVAVVVIGHGANAHKASANVEGIAACFVARGVACLAIDGPVHGDRSPEQSTDPDVSKRLFRAAWAQGVGRDWMAADYACALDTFQSGYDLAQLPVGFIGVAMGTAYGLPLLASDARFKAAVIGMWSLNYAASAHLVDHAKKMSCRLMFIQQLQDEFFDAPGALALFETVGSADKRLVSYMGAHRPLDGERLLDAADFLVGSLLRA
jgi:hypothetical protein